MKGDRQLDIRLPTILPYFKQPELPEELDQQIAPKIVLETYEGKSLSQNLSPVLAYAVAGSWLTGLLCF